MLENSKIEHLNVRDQQKPSPSLSPVVAEDPLLLFPVLVEYRANRISAQTQVVVVMVG